MIECKSRTVKADAQTGEREEENQNLIAPDRFLPRDDYINAVIFFLCRLFSNVQSGHIEIHTSSLFPSLVICIIFLWEENASLRNVCKSIMFIKEC